MKAPNPTVKCSKCKGVGIVRPNAHKAYEYCKECSGVGTIFTLSPRERRLAAALNEIYENTEPAIGGIVSENARAALLEIGYTD